MRYATRTHKAVSNVAWLITFTLLLSACGGSEATTDSSSASANVPSWYLNPTPDNDYILGKGEGTSSQRRIALKKAEMRARSDIAVGMETRVNAYISDFSETVPTEDREAVTEFFTATGEEIVSETLRGTTVREQELVVEDGKYTAFVQMGMPVGKMAERLLSRIQSNEQAYARLRATEALNTLEEKVQNYRDERSANEGG